MADIANYYGLDLPAHTLDLAWRDYNSAPAVVYAEFAPPSELRGLAPSLPIDPVQLHAAICASALLVWQHASQSLTHDEREALLAGDIIAFGGFQDPRMRFTYRRDPSTRAVHAYCAILEPSPDEDAYTHIRYLPLCVVAPVFPLPILN